MIILLIFSLSSGPEPHIITAVPGFTTTNQCETAAIEARSFDVGRIATKCVIGGK